MGAASGKAPLIACGDADIERTAGARGTVGVGIPGTLSLDSGRVKNANSTWLLGRPLKGDLERALDREVRIANDANCFAVSEATDGVAQGAARASRVNQALFLRGFFREADRRGLDTEIDANGITWAWATPQGANAVVTGSHLDSVPGGGEFDGPLGVASALAAFDVLNASGALDQSTRPFALAVFPEEEGSRFGVACLNSILFGHLELFWGQLVVEIRHNVEVSRQRIGDLLGVQRRRHDRDVDDVPRLQGRAGVLRHLDDLDFGEEGCADGDSGGS